MSRFLHMVMGAAVLVLCCVALPQLSTAQEVTIDSQGRSVTTAPPTASTPSPQAIEPGSAIPEGTVTIYSNFAPGHSFDPIDAWTESGPASPVGAVIQAMAFTPTKATYRLTRIDLAIGWLAGSNGYKLELRDDNDGQPGQLIASWGVTRLPAFGATSSRVDTVRMLSFITLFRGHQYWLVPIVRSDEWAGWNWNTVSATGNFAWSTDGGSTWTVAAGTTLGAFDVLGFEVPY